MNSIVEISNLSKDYEVGFWKKKKVRALDDLTLSVQGGQIFGFLGGNGAGKTTTLKAICTLLQPNWGEVQVFGRSVRSDAAAVRAASRWRGSRRRFW